MAKKATKKKRGAAEAVPLSNDMFDEVAKFHNDNALQFDHDIDESEEDADRARQKCVPNDILVKR